MAALPALPASGGDGSKPTSGVGNTSGVMSFKLLGLELFTNLFPNKSLRNGMINYKCEACCQICLIMLIYHILIPAKFVRLTFPTVTATTTPLQVLPQFVEVLGRKIDKIQGELDSLHFTKHVEFATTCQHTIRSLCHKPLFA